MNKKIYILIPAIIFFLFNLSCTAERNNPLDPNNPDNKLVTLEGYVKSLSFPRVPLSETTLILSGTDLYKTTDQNGYFRLNNLRPVDTYLKIEKEGYRTDSILIVWGGQKIVNLEILLNKLPYSDSSSLSSVVINYYFRDPTTYLVLIDKIVDSDNANEIDSVVVYNNELKLYKALDYNISKKYFETSLTPEELNINNIEMSVGKDFIILVKDIYNNITEVTRERVQRIIKSEVQFDSPKDLDVVSSSPTLKWEKFLPGFSFSYAVDIYTNETMPNLVWHKDNISSDSTSVKVSNALPSGDYFWIIWCVDEFKNKSCSKPASFTVN